jgi:hypothetical protein
VLPAKTAQTLLVTSRQYLACLTQRDERQVPVNCCQPLPKSDHMLVCDRSSTAYIMTLQGQVAASCIRLHV